MRNTPAPKGIILAGGRGTRLYPATRVTVKQLLLVYDKPMIYYPLCTLMDGGIRDILIISTPEALPGFRALLADGSQWGIRLSYAPQQNPGGLAEALLIGRDFAAGEPICLILGDNLFHGPGFSELLKTAMEDRAAAGIFPCRVKDPRAFGICEFGSDGSLVSITEKPEDPKSDFAVPGLYLYPGDGARMAKALRPSPRGELEITDLNNAYLRLGRLALHPMPEDTVWFDLGTPEDLLAASAFVKAAQEATGVYIGCPEETAYRNGFITGTDLRRLGRSMESSAYGNYILKLAGEKF